MSHIEKSAEHPLSAGMLLGAVLSSFIGLALGGCSVADSFGPRAIVYNNETNSSKTSVILLNILRSAHRLPLQFTELSTITGSATSQGSLSLNLPFTGVGGAATPVASISGGPNFAVGNLNTQEFYQGLQTPLRAEVIGALLDQGVRPQVLFPLVFSRIEIIENNQVRALHFDVPSPVAFNAVYAFADRLAASGLYVTQTKKAKSDKERDVYQFCFDPARAPDNSHEELPDSNLFLTKLNKIQPIRLAFGDQRDLNGYKISQKLNCKSRSFGTLSRDLEVRFTTRSLAGMYAFIGSIVRMELGLDGPAAAVQVSDPENPFQIFSIKLGVPGPLDPTANFGGSNYFVNTDPTGKDASSEVMHILSTLQALNSKASSIPSPNIAILAR